MCRFIVWDCWGKIRKKRTVNFHFYQIGHIRAIYERFHEPPYNPDPSNLLKCLLYQFIWKHEAIIAVPFLSVYHLKSGCRKFQTVRHDYHYNRKFMLRHSEFFSFMKTVN